MTTEQNNASRHGHHDVAASPCPLGRLDRTKGSPRHPAGVTQQARGVFDQAAIGPAEQQHLADGLGRCLRERRAVTGRTWMWPGVYRAGLSIRAAAEEIGCSASSLSRLERGLQRPRASMLSSISAVYAAPDKTDELTDHLVALAGESLRPETWGSARRRSRRVRQANVKRYRMARTAQELLNESIVGQARLLDQLDLTPISKGFRSNATEGQVRAAEQAMRHANIILNTAQAQRVEADRLIGIVQRRNSPTARRAGSIITR